jgi:hypothetical protein
MEPSIYSLCTQNSAVWSFIDPTESSSYVYTLIYPLSSFNTILSFTYKSVKVSSHKIFRPKYRTSYFPMLATCPAHLIILDFIKPAYIL